MLRHHLDLALIVLLDELLVILRLIDLLAQRLLPRPKLLLHLLHLLLPLVVLLEHLEAGALAEAVDRVEFLGELDELTIITILQIAHSLCI